MRETPGRIMGALYLKLDIFMSKLQVYWRQYKYWEETTEDTIHRKLYGNWQTSFQFIKAIYRSI